MSGVSSPVMTTTDKVLRVNLRTGDAWLGSERLFLPGRLHDTLLKLASHPGRCIPPARISIEHGDSPGENHVACLLIWRLRRVLGKDAIKTWPGHGYVLLVPVEHIVE